MLFLILFKNMARKYKSNNEDVAISGDKYVYRKDYGTGSMKRLLNEANAGLRASYKSNDSITINNN